MECSKCRCTSRGLLRPLRIAGLSDGTLRYLLLFTALLTPRPPALLVLNEPKTNLHPSLLRPLARLIAKGPTRRGSSSCPMRVLVDALAEKERSTEFELKKELGETVIEIAEAPAWTWPRR